MSTETLNLMDNSQLTLELASTDPTSAPGEFKPDACCERPTIANMDHTKGFDSDAEGVRCVVNRVCTRCWVHWYGEKEVKRYSRREWDEWMNQ